MKDIEAFFSNNTAPVQEIRDDRLEKKGIRLLVKREDLLHPLVSGNKMRKMKYNLLEAKKSGKSMILTFGGAYSNHIHATAAVGKLFGFSTIGIIRGEEYEKLNPTLRFAIQQGMELIYVERKQYRERNTMDFLEEIRLRFPDAYILPEGGSNVLAVKGCVEIVKGIQVDFDVIGSCCGTGGTLAGIISGLNGEMKVLGFPVLKGGEFLNREIHDLVHSYCHSEFNNWQLIQNYHFGGYAKYSQSLLDFINRFKREHGIQLDPVYTGKLLFGLYDMVDKHEFPRGTTLMALHTGGLQGIDGFNERFGNLIEI
jgi:1-aminocyclopropane-1-carboxylate deaminase/D-cysteine desulfhydrase-like pyridoxal-dependent ACC family enzyme